MKNVLHKLWTEEHPLITLWATGMMAMAFSGIIYMILQFIINPSSFENITWGLIDHI